MIGMSTENRDLVRTGSTAQRLAQKPYEQRMCRIECYPGCVSWEPSYHGMSVEEWVDFIDEIGMEVQIVNGEVNRGTPRFNSRMIEPHKDVANERLPQFLKLAHEKGIIILSYYPIIFTKPMKTRHPEWLMEFLDDGGPKPDNQGWFCFNSPYRDWLPEYLLEWLDHLDLDGFYFDDTNYGSHDSPPWTPSCCCSYCQEQFHLDTGFDLPRRVDFDSMTFRRFLNWRYEKMVDFMHHLFAKIRARYPDAILDLNSYMRPATDWTFGHPLASLRLEEVGGYFFVEAFRSIRECGFVAKVLRSTGTPFGVFRNVTQSIAGIGHAPYPEIYAASLSGYAAMINGGAPCGGPFGQSTLLQRDAMKEVFANYKKREPYVAGDTLKYLALHYSQMNRDFRPSEIPKNTGGISFHEVGQKDQYGAFEMLNRSQVVFDIVLDEHLMLENLQRYAVLFLSNSACLSDAHVSVVRAFVEQGGTLIATHQTSLLDEWGQRRANFALAEVMGVDYKDGEDADHPVIYAPHDRELEELLGHILCSFSAESSIETRYGAQVLCTRCKPGLVDLLRYFDPRMEYDSGEPAVISNVFGNGRSIYICGDVGGAYMNTPYPQLRRFINYLVGLTPSPIEVEAPECIEMTAAYRDSGELMIHLLNNPVPVLPWHINDKKEYEEQQSTFHAPLEVNPIRGVKIRLNELAGSSARLPLRKCALEILGTPGVIVVPEVDLHEVLLVETAA